MITDMVNLGPPQKASLDTKVSARKSSLPNGQVDHEPGSFEQTMQTAQTNKFTDQGIKPASRETQIEKRYTTSETVNAKGLSERQKVMQKFMDSMESEFGIPPERIVEAMAQLSDDQLLKSPEDTVSQVISQLDLDPVEAEKAEAMYLSMVLQLAATLPQVRDPEPLNMQQKVILAASSGMGLEQALSSKDRRLALNQSLDQMNQKFFMKPSDVLKNSESPSLLNSELKFDKPDASTNLYSKNNGIDAQKFQTYEQIKSIPTQFKPAQDAPAEMLVNSQASSNEPARPMTPSEIEADAQSKLMQGLAALGAVASDLSEAIQADPENKAAVKVEQALRQEGLLTEPAMVNEVKTGFELKHEFSSSDQSPGQDKDKGFDALSAAPKTHAESATDFFVKPQAAVDSSLQQASSPKQSVDVPPMLVPPKQGEQQDNSVNIKQLMNQAQYMIKKGGGEAIVKMSPEGLGQVHLKVVLNEGKVNVQMSAENNETKKLIEASLGDLKNSLSAHKLSVDHVKVDVGNQLSSQNDNSNNSSQFKHDQNREQARQFMGQFREENFNRRDGFFEMPGIKAYTDRTKGPEPLQPSSEARSIAMNRYKGAGKGSGLDLVA